MIALDSKCHGKGNMFPPVLCQMKVRDFQWKKSSACAKTTWPTLGGKMDGDLTFGIEEFLKPF